MVHSLTSRPGGPEDHHGLALGVVGGVGLWAVRRVDPVQQVEGVLAPRGLSEAEGPDGRGRIQQADGALHQRGELGDAQHQLCLRVLQLQEASRTIRWQSPQCSSKVRLSQSKLDFTDLDFTYNLNFTYFFLRTDFLLHTKTQFYIPNQYW